MIRRPNSANPRPARCGVPVRLTRYRGVVTATDHRDEPTGSTHPLAPGASPQSIADALLPTDRGQFLTEYDRLMDDARHLRDLRPVHEMLEHWRGIAVLQADPERFRRAVRRAAELLTGEPVPADEPLERTRAKAGM